MALFIPVVNSLSKLLQVDEEDYGIMAMKRKMLLLCKLDLGVVKLNIFTVLDPRFKNRVFSSQVVMRRTQEKLVFKCEETLQLNTNEGSPDTPSPKRA